MTRRELMVILAVARTGSPISRASMLFGPTHDTDWVKYAGNPVLGGQYGTCFDVCVLYEAGIYRMWLSWRPKKSVALTQSPDGIHWNPPEIVLGPRPETGWEDEINRPIVVRREDGYHMWYTGQANGESAIGYATGPDGRKWTRLSAHPVLQSTVPWEGVAVMCPDAMWDAGHRIWKMWYSAGAQYEPNAIGHATSKDGLHWEKYAANPVMRPDPGFAWEKDRVTAAQVIVWKGWYYSFYIGFSDINHAQIGMARSQDGIRNWVRYARNPIVRPTAGGWDADACYKPFAVLSGNRWMLWYNGRHKTLEQIGLVCHEGEDLEFVAA